MQNGTIKIPYIIKIIKGTKIWLYGRNPLLNRRLKIIFEQWAKIAKVTRSPRLAAIGVATLSGLIFSLLEAKIKKKHT